MAHSSLIVTPNRRGYQQSITNALTVPIIFIICKDLLPIIDIITQLGLGDVSMKKPNIITVALRRKGEVLHLDRGRY
jgi:hypothetical protein